jgi:hypothetical protein
VADKHRGLEQRGMTDLTAPACRKWPGWTTLKCRARDQTEATFDEDRHLQLRPTGTSRSELS